MAARTRCQLAVLTFAVAFLCSNAVPYQKLTSKTDISIQFLRQIVNKILTQLTKCRNYCVFVLILPMLPMTTMDLCIFAVPTSKTY